MFKPLNENEAKRVSKAWKDIRVVEKYWLYNGIQKASPWLPERLHRIFAAFEILVNNYNDNAKNV
jgi:hypothetical protein